MIINWMYVYRVLNGAITVALIWLGLMLTTQGLGFSPQALTWIGLVVAGLGATQAALPSVFGQSSAGPPGKTEGAVVREAEVEAVTQALGGRSASRRTQG